MRIQSGSTYRRSDMESLANSEPGGLVVLLREPPRVHINDATVRFEDQLSHVVPDHRGASYRNAALES